MKRKIALKRLSASDLTLFEPHYRNSPGTKQKAINLDAGVFVSALFPGLPSRLLTRDRVIVTLAIFGPGGASAHSITRKILKQQKNWRLNGELIVNPPEEPSRYDLLSKGDYAIIDFAGELEPHTARMYLVAKKLPQDLTLHSALEAQYGSLFSDRKGMEEIDQEELAALLNKVGLPEGHPVLDFIDFDALEDAALGGFDGVTKLRRRRRARGVSRDELNRARQSAEQIGRVGEEILNSWLETERNEKNGPSFSWDSDSNAVAPYDFTILDGGTVSRRIDAKSTAGDFKNPVHVSLAELEEMVHGGVPYDLYRLYSINDTTARLRIAFDLGGVAKEVLDHVNNLPNGIAVDGVSIKPEVLKFDEEIVINLLQGNDSDEQTEGDYSED